MPVLEDLVFVPFLLGEAALSHWIVLVVLFLFLLELYERLLRYTL